MKLEIATTSMPPTESSSTSSPTGCRHRRRGPRARTRHNQRAATHQDALAEAEKASINVGYFEWEKVKQTEVSKNTGKQKSAKTRRNPKHLPAAELGKVVLQDFEKFKEHLERDWIMKRELKKVRLEALEDAEVAVLHCDWAEQHKVTEIAEVQSAYFNGRYSYDLHTGYQCVTNCNSACLSGTAHTFIAPKSLTSIFCKKKLELKF